MEVHINDITFKVDETSEKPFWEFVNTGQWEPQTFRIIDHFVSENDVVLDIGCWIGPISLYAAARGARVYAIDPDPMAYEAFIKNLQTNPEINSKIHPYHLAISAESQPIQLHARSNYGNSSSSMLQRTRDTKSHVEATGLSLDQFFKTANIHSADFIKMDIEAGEFEVLPAIIPFLISIDLPTLFISFHYDHLNEYVYRKRIRSKFLSLLLMKLEKILGIHLFGKKLKQIIGQALTFSEQYAFTYDEFGNRLSSSERSPSALLRAKLNLVFTNEEWVSRT